MAKLPVCSGTQAVRAFEKLGYEKMAQRGSHVRMKCEGKKPLTIPMHRTLAKGMLRTLIRNSGSSVEEFNEAL